MRLIESFCTNNACYKAGRKIMPKGIMLHSVGVNQPSAKAFADRWNVGGLNVLPHAVLDADGNVYQCLPWDRYGWHCGKGSKGSANATHIGVEMTEPATIRYTGGASWTDTNPAITGKFIRNTYLYAVELFAELCEMYALDPLADGVIISHSEGYKRGIASNHGDIEHIWSRFSGYTMDEFRQDVSYWLKPPKAAITLPPIESAEPPTLDNTPREWEAKAVESAIRRGILKGDDNGDLMLHKTATRADVLVFLERAGII